MYLSILKNFIASVALGSMFLFGMVGCLHIHEYEEEKRIERVELLVAQAAADQAAIDQEGY